MRTNRLSRYEPIVDIYAPMRVGLPPGVTEADISGRPVRTTTCDCGCGAVIREGEECYLGEGGEVFVEIECAHRYYGVRYGDWEGE